MLRLWVIVFSLSQHSQLLIGYYMVDLQSGFFRFFAIGIFLVWFNLHLYVRIISLFSDWVYFSLSLSLLHEEYALAMSSTALAVLLGCAVEDPKMATEFLPLLFVPQVSTDWLLLREHPPFHALDVVTRALFTYNFVFLPLHSIASIRWFLCSNWSDSQLVAMGSIFMFPYLWGAIGFACRIRGLC